LANKLQKLRVIPFGLPNAGHDKQQPYGQQQYAEWEWGLFKQKVQ
jgi:hypothetical protein